MILSRPVLLRMTKFSDKCCREVKRHILCSTTFRKSRRFRKYDRARQAYWVENVQFACQWLSQEHTHPHIIFKSDCFSMATMVTRSRFDVTLYVCCLPYSDRSKLFNHEQNVSPDTVNMTSLCNYDAQNHNQNTLAHTSTNCDLSKEWSTYSVQLHCSSHKSEATYMEYTKKALQIIHVTGQCRPLTIKLRSVPV
jgi:hypothetical protein